MTTKKKTSWIEFLRELEKHPVMVVLSVLLTVLAILYYGSSLLEKMKAPGTRADEKQISQHPPPAPVPSPIPDTLHQIISPVPDKNETVKFTTDIGQGGRVEVKGLSHGLESGPVILLTVTAKDGIERPQTKSSPVRPDGNGQWETTVQVGDANHPPVAGDKFTVKMYLVPEFDFNLLCDSAGQGGAVWPMKDRPSATPVARCTFILSQ